MNPWQEGIERGPDGLAREIPVKHVWASSVWITKRGVARRRWFNVATKAWAWDADRSPLAEDEGGNVGYHVPQFMSVERAICTAWRLRAEESGPSIGEWIRVQLVDKLCDEGCDGTSVEDGVRAENLRWQIEEDGEDGPIEGERWSRLRGAVGAVTIPKGYWISSAGRLKNPKGEVTRGSFAFDRRWAAIRGCGLVDLWSEAGLAGPIGLPVYVRRARGAILAGATPERLAAAAGVEVGTAWSYLTQAAPHVEASALRGARRSAGPSGHLEGGEDAGGAGGRAGGRVVDRAVGGGGANGSAAIDGVAGGASDGDAEAGEGGAHTVSRRRASESRPWIHRHTPSCRPWVIDLETKNP